MGRRDSRNPGLFGVDTIEMVERANFGERVREEVSVIRVCERHEVRLGQ
ncbi:MULTISPECIES: hypothetical protein [unclassified Streptomyces]|nr:hypothetical protein [Streptomyces sp. NBC_01750]WSB01386.1 hypothetical protein OIE54_19970 [Streptomyces sp. NBC_01794]WSD34266.1 hypothetical protein OG966_21700 [Streptomyces sp. NBC_01750]